MNMDDLKFTAKDFENVPFYNDKTAERANILLAARLEKAPVVFKQWLTDEDGGDEFPEWVPEEEIRESGWEKTHRARLVCIEQLELPGMMPREPRDDYNAQDED